MCSIFNFQPDHLAFFSSFTIILELFYLPYFVIQIFHAVRHLVNSYTSLIALPVFGMVSTLLITDLKSVLFFSACSQNILLQVK